jgi:predicted kinase
MSKLYILCGAPGAGKSTYARDLANRLNITIVSRDVVRFSMVSEDEEYFSKEKAVFKEFIRQINEHLKNNEDVIADATHLNRASRKKLIKNITVKPTDVEAIFVNTPLEICLERNENRKGTRSYVPPTSIKNMFYSIEKPDYHIEDWIDTITIVEDNKSLYFEF